jgi:hypothetical protein
MAFSSRGLSSARLDRWMGGCIGVIDRVASRRPMASQADGAPVWATWPALHDQRALYRIPATVLALLDKGGLASHRCNGNFGEGWRPCTQPCPSPARLRLVRSRDRPTLHTQGWCAPSKRGVPATTRTGQGWTSAPWRCREGTPPIDVCMKGEHISPDVLHNTPFKSVETIRGHSTPAVAPSRLIFHFKRW